ncbi:MAG: bifunctional glutamate N-acetyltransferase/amino-acid acetyltransferase ArgJ [Candidatus Nanopelagicales bacterium]|jgi:glutamate N-acetyltransferase/amino-acid N-acetyltransferase|nr:bifunctional glutamate N-acetyltransferase/amino-acid acetyltransferase ArgJ [Candidatus Nanopelagicales bacterium]
MSVTYPLGFRASGVTAGLKKSGAPDVAVVVNDGPDVHAAAVFTRNRIQAAPVLWSRQVVADGVLRAVVLNSGGANACTGPEGFADTHHTAEAVAEQLGIGAIDVAVCSTGLIGERLDMPRLLAGVRDALNRADAQGGDDAAHAIMTTDTVAKTAVFEDGYRIGGMAKGAGMLAPGMATMLSVITTDAVITAQDLDAALRACTATTFDRVDADGCMSTNDTVIIMASGASGIAANDGFVAGLHAVCADLSRKLAADAEGASKLIDVHVRGAASVDDAELAARAVARSALFKCAMFGEDPNWGRVLSAVGTTNAVFDPLHIDVAINGVMVCRDSAPGEPREAVDLSGKQVAVIIDLHAGDAEATIVTTDLTTDYVHENSAYST